MPHSAENTACKGTPLEPPRLPMPTRSASFGLTSRLLGTGFGTRFIFFSVLPFSFQQSFWMRGTLCYFLDALRSPVFNFLLSVRIIPLTAYARHREPYKACEGLFNICCRLFLSRDCFSNVLFFGDFRGFEEQKPPLIDSLIKHLITFLITLLDNNGLEMTYLRDFFMRKVKASTMKGEKPLDKIHPCVIIVIGGVFLWLN